MLRKCKHANIIQTYFFQFGNFPRPGSLQKVMGCSQLSNYNDSLSRIFRERISLAYIRVKRVKGDFRVGEGHMERSQRSRLHGFCTPVN